jgi:hypothetical protein
MAIVDFLNAAKDLVLFVLQALESIVLAVLDALGDALAGLQSAWTAAPDIPILSWLYKYVITGTPQNPGDTLTLLDLMSLLLAVPATILYKLLIGHGTTPPFTASDVATLTSQGLPWPAVPSSSAGRVATARLGAVPASLATTMGCVAGVAVFFGTFITMGADALAFVPEPIPGLTKFVSWASLIQGLVSQVCGAPWATFAKTASWNTADVWTTILWAASFVPFAYDSVFTFTTGALARYTAELGPILDTGAGWVMTAIGIATLFEQAQSGSGYTGWDCANSLVPQIARGFKFLVLSKDDPEDSPIAMGILVIVDLVLGLGATVTQVGDAVAG